MLSNSSSTIEDSWSEVHPGVLDKTLFADAVVDFDGDGLFNFEEVGLLLPLPDGGTRPAAPGSAHTVHTILTDAQVAWPSGTTSPDAGQLQRLTAFVFFTSRTPSTRIFLSAALHMS